MQRMKTFFDSKTKKAACIYCGCKKEMPPFYHLELFLTATMQFEKAYQNCKAANEHKPLFS